METPPLNEKLTNAYATYNDCKVKYLQSNGDPKALEALKKAKKTIESINYNYDGVENKINYKPYPDYNNPNFVKEISSKKEFDYNKNEFNYNSEYNPCDAKDFELSNHQIFLKNFMNNKTPYKGLLLYHGVGTGKTCSAVSIAENFRDIYGRRGKKGEEDKRIIVLVPNTNVENGWRRNIFDINKGDAQCTGNTFFNELNELNDKSDNTEKINKKVNKIINKYYDFYGYREFANKIDRIIKENININPLKPGDDIEQWKEQINLKRRNVIKELFSNKLIIVDEVHNLRSTEKNEEKKESLRRLEEIAENTDNLKLVLLSATPMFDNKNEIEWLINLLLRNDKRETISIKDILKKDGSLNEKLLKQKCRGYISYLRGENPQSFPIRLHPCDNGDKECYDPTKLPHKDYRYPKKDIFGNPIMRDKIEFTKLYFDAYQGAQLNYNEKLLKGLKSVDLNVQTDLRSKSNICYPNELDFQDTFEKVGSVYKYKTNVDFLKETELKDHSIKMFNILQSIKNSSGIIFIFSEFISNGCIPMALVLERNGFKKYGNKSIFSGKKEKQKYIDDSGKITDRKTDYQASYILLTGTSSNKQKEIEALRSDKNKNGGVIKVIIGSPTVAEGLDFKRIREVHIMDPWYNLNKIEQIIGRGIRFCSHNDLEEKYRNVTVYLHAGYMKKKESIDIHIYKDAEKKAKEMGEIEKILKESAVDCYLNSKMNHITDEDVETIEYVSSQNNSNELLPSDKSYTKICSFNEDCKINCKVKGVVANDTSTINYELLNNLLNKIAKEIIILFANTEINQTFFSFTGIVDKLKEKFGEKFDETIIKKTLGLMVRNKTPFKNCKGLNGYLISKSKDDVIYILFQPKENKNENISLYRRRTKKKDTDIKNNMIKKYYGDYKKRTIKKDNLDLEKYITDKFNEIKNMFLNKKNRISTEDFDNNINNGTKIYKDISEGVVFFIIDTIDKSKKESLYESLILEYDNYKSEDKSLMYRIYNHLRLNFIYEGYKILENKNKSKPIGYFYNNLNHARNKQKLQDIINKYTFKVLNDNEEFGDISLYNRKSLLKINKGNLKNIKITDKEIYGYTINKSNTYFLKVYNDPGIHTFIILPGKTVNEGNFKNHMAIKLLEDLNLDVLVPVNTEIDQSKKKTTITRRENEIYLTIKLNEMGLYVRYDLYPLSINLEDALENNPNK